VSPKAVVLSAWLATLAGAFALRAQTTHPTTTSTTTRPSTSPSIPTAPTGVGQAIGARVSMSEGFAPITYFEDNCARCHGSNGSAYGPEFGKHLSDAQLTKVIDDMAVGPGNAPVNARQLDVLVAYHHAMIARQPFVAVTKTTPTGEQLTLEGEVTPNTALTVGNTVATVDGTNWSVTIPKGQQPTVTAKPTDPASPNPTSR